MGEGRKGWGGGPPAGRERVSGACALCSESLCVCWRELGLHDNWPGRLAVLSLLTWLEEGAPQKVRGRSCGKLARSRYRSLNGGSWGPGLPNGLWCEPDSAENGVGRKAPRFPGKLNSRLGLFSPLFLALVLGCFQRGRRVSVICA